MSMTSSRPFIVRALYEWIQENDCTPHLLVNALAKHVEVPQQFVKNGQIVLNISPVSVIDLLMTNDAVQFNGRFGGMPMDIYVPMTAVMGIYTRENGQGMIFEVDDSEPPTPDPIKPGSKPDKKSAVVKKSTEPVKNKAGLRVVK